MKQLLKQCKNIIAKYRHAWILLYGVVYSTWFFYLEKIINAQTRFHVMHTALDDRIPFNEYFIIPYLLWFLYVAGAILYFLFVNKDDYYRLCAFLFIGMTVSLVICSFYPNGTNLRPAVDPDKNLCSAVVAWLYSKDTCTNVFPSIHVFNSVGVNIAILRSRDIARLKHGKAVKAASSVLMVLIILATMFLKQHSVLDVSGALILASIMYGVVYGYPVFDAQTQENGGRNRRKIADRV